MTREQQKIQRAVALQRVTVLLPQPLLRHLLPGRVHFNNNNRQWRQPIGKLLAQAPVAGQPLHE